MTIKTNNLSCGYKNKCVLRNINIELHTGTAVCVLGPNGAGKSTFFKTLLRQLTPLAGGITIDGKDISALTLGELARVFAYVPQAKGYAYQFSVQDMVLMGRAAHIGRFSGPDKDDILAVQKAAEALGIQDLLHRRYSELSGGEQQIVLIARALAQESAYIILDEPASNLDFANQSKLLSVIRDLIDSGTGVIMSSHSPSHAFACCKRTILINKSEVIYGQTDDVVSEMNLTNMYGVPIAILQDKKENGTRIKACCLKDYE